MARRVSRASAAHALIVPVRVKLDRSREFENAETFASRDEFGNGGVDSLLLSLEAAELHRLYDQFVV